MIWVASLGLLAPRCLWFGEASNWGTLQALHQRLWNWVPNWKISQYLCPFGTWNGKSFTRKSTGMVFFSCLLNCILSLYIFIIGGREKAQAAFCRKAIASIDKIEMWGDGLQTRSFTFIDESVEGVLCNCCFFPNLAEASIFLSRSCLNSIYSMNPNINAYDFSLKNSKISLAFWKSTQYVRCI